MIVVVIVMLDEGYDLSVETSGLLAVFEQDSALQDLVLLLDLTLSLRVIRCSPNMPSALVLEPVSRTTFNIRCVIVAQQPRSRHNGGAMQADAARV
jgi:hypothetical protein